jgi:hypothetical protein
MMLPASTSLLFLLRQGIRIELPNGMWLWGDPETQYLDYGTESGSLGLWNLTDEGIESALADLRKMEADKGYPQWLTK